MADPAVGAQGNAQRAIDAIVSLRRDLGLDRTIRDLGGSDPLLPILVEDAVNDPVNRSNPRPLQAADFEGLYRAAW